MSTFHRGTHEIEMIREEHGHTANNDLGTPGKKVIPVDFYALKLTESGDATYIALALPGTEESEAKWQVRKLDQSSGLVITWADGNPEFDNVATDLTALSYA